MATEDVLKMNSKVRDRWKRAVSGYEYVDYDGSEECKAALWIRKLYVKHTPNGDVLYKEGSPSDTMIGPVKKGNTLIIYILGEVVLAPKNAFMTDINVGVKVQYGDKVNISHRNGKDLQMRDIHLSFNGDALRVMEAIKTRDDMWYPVLQRVLEAGIQKIAEDMR